MARRLRATDELEAGRRQLTRPRLTRSPAFDAAIDRARFPTGYFLRPVVDVARSLLGSCIVSDIDGERCVGLIVETEAYGGHDDPASHASTRGGVTERNRAMFGPPGHLYVYRSYGIHWCTNVVTGAVGQGQAVLLRGAVPLEGRDAMRHRRRGRTPIAAGPGRLSEALGITGDLYGHELTRPPLRLVPGWAVADDDVGVSGRIGIRAAADWPHRFYLRRWPGHIGTGSVTSVEEIDSP